VTFGPSHCSPPEFGPPPTCWSSPVSSSAPDLRAGNMWSNFRPYPTPIGYRRIHAPRLVFCPPEPSKIPSGFVSVDFPWRDPSCSSLQVVDSGFPKSALLRSLFSTRTSDVRDEGPPYQVSSPCYFSLSHAWVFFFPCRLVVPTE